MSPVWKKFIAAAAVLTTLPAQPALAEKIVVSEDRTTITIVDTESMIKENPIFIGFSPEQLGVSKDGKHLFVLNSSHNILTKIDSDKPHKPENFYVGRSPWHTVLSDDENTAFSVNYYNKEITKIGFQKGDRSTIVLSQNPTGIDFVGDKVFVISKNGDFPPTYASLDPFLWPKGKLSVFNAISKNKIAEMEIDSDPIALKVITPSLALVAFSQDKKLTLYDLDKMSVIRSYPLEAKPYAIALSKDKSTALIAAQSNNDKTEIYTLDVQTSNLTNKQIVDGHISDISASYSNENTFNIARTNKGEPMPLLRFNANNNSFETFANFKPRLVVSMKTL